MVQLKLPSLDVDEDRVAIRLLPLYNIIFTLPTVPVVDQVILIVSVT